MITITSIEKSGKRTMQVFLNGEPAFPVYTSALRGLGISRGMQLEGEEAASLLRSVEKMAQTAAMNMLLRRSLSEHELRQKLLRRGYAAEFTEKAIDYVRSFHYIDDSRYAESFIAFRAGKESRSRIRIKLRQKGIDDQIIEQELERADFDDSEGIRRDLDRLLRKYGQVPDRDSRDYQKICQSLLRRGYSWHDVRQALDTFSKTV